MEQLTSIITNLLSFLVVNFVKVILNTMLTYPFNALILLLIILYVVFKLFINALSQKHLASDASKLRN